MPVIQLDVATSKRPREDDDLRHLTLVHFELPPEPHLRLQKITALEKIVRDFTTRNRGRMFGGVWGERRSDLGRWHNVTAQMVDSPDVVAIQGVFVRALAQERFAVSTTFAHFSPHVSKPVDSWVPGEEVPFLKGISWICKPDSAWHEL